MTKLAAATIFAVVALAAQSAAACDWNHEASTDQQQVATTATTAAPAQTAQPATAAPTVAAEASRPATPTAPVVLVNDRH
jgi:hypothetical protein